MVDSLKALDLKRPIREADVLSYFRATAITEERRVSDAGYSFARRKTDAPKKRRRAALLRALARVARETGAQPVPT
jgi:hypothetical protein